MKIAYMQHKRVISIEEYKYKNATIRVHGEVNREKIEEATIIFLKKADRCRRNKLKENKQNGNKNTPRAI